MNMAQNSGGVNVNELMKDSDKPKYSQGEKWVCECGMENTMRFCPNCGKSKPEQKKCPECGFAFPPELQNMKFCPNCGHAMKGD